MIQDGEVKTASRRSSVQQVPENHHQIINHVVFKFEGYGVIVLYVVVCYFLSNRKKRKKQRLKANWSSRTRRSWSRVNLNLPQKR